MKHSYAVHMKYERVPPFPWFIPPLHLQLKDTVLFNTGDQLMALSVESKCSDPANLNVGNAGVQTDERAGCAGHLPSSISSETGVQNISGVTGGKSKTPENSNEDLRSFGEKKPSEEQTGLTVFNHEVHAATETNVVRGVLPVTATGFSGKNLRSVHASSSRNCSAFHRNLTGFTCGEFSEVLVVKQVLVDFEECISHLIDSDEALRTQYKSLFNYDARVVGVSPESSEVTVMIKLLVYTRSTRLESGLPVSPRFVQQCLSVALVAQPATCGFMAILRTQLTIYRPHTNHIYRPHIDRLYRPDTNHIPTKYCPDTNHMPTKYRPDTNHILAHTVQITTTYRPPLPTIYQPDQLVHDYPT